MNYYIEAFTKHYFDFSGRARRQEYWTFWLFQILVAIGLVIVDAIVGTGFIFVSVYYLAAIIPTIAITVRRLHDTGRSGWWYLLVLVPFGSIVIFIFTLIDSTPGSNQYGPNPKGIGNNVSPPATSSRLENLESLLRTGMITQAEYDERRRAILAEV